MGSQDPRNDRLPRSWIAARSLCSFALSPLFPLATASLSLRSFLLVLFPPSICTYIHMHVCVRVCVRASNLRVFRAACFYRHERQFMTSRHSATATTSPRLPLLLSPPSTPSLMVKHGRKRVSRCCSRFVGPSAHAPISRLEIRFRG